MSPPFRADHVGSFLRPARLRAAREKFFAREIDAPALRAVEDECIREVVKRQQDVGLKGITDGEFRRTYFHVDFLERLEGVDVRYGEFSSAFRKDDGTQVGFKPPTMHVEKKIRHASSIQGPDYEFLKSVVTQTPKVCIPRALDAALSRRPGGDQPSRLSPAGGFLRRSDAGLRRRDRRPRPTWATLSATRRHQPGLSLRPRDPRAHTAREATTRTRWCGSIASWSTTRSPTGPRT